MGTHLSSSLAGNRGREMLLDTSPGKAESIARMTQRDGKGDILEGKHGKMQVKTWGWPPLQGPQAGPVVIC